MERCMNCSHIDFVYEAYIENRRVWVCQDCLDKEFSPCEVCGALSLNGYNYDDRYCYEHTPKLIVVKMKISNFVYGKLWKLKRWLKK